MQAGSRKKSSCTEAVGLQDTNWSTLPVLFQLLVNDKITCTTVMTHESVAAESQGSVAPTICLDFVSDQNT